MAELNWKLNDVWPLSLAMEFTAAATVIAVGVASGGGVPIQADVPLTGKPMNHILMMSTFGPK